MKLATGAEMRVTGSVGECAVVCVNGGQHREVEGTWSASVEWLVDQLAPRLPELAFAEVRYRVKSWRRLESCVEDARAAVYEVGAPRVALARLLDGRRRLDRDRARAEGRGGVGLAPWIPDQLDVSPLRGKRLTRDPRIARPLASRASRVSRAPTRARASTARASAARRAATSSSQARVHGIALRSPWGKLVTLPKADRWAELVEEELRRFAAT